MGQSSIADKESTLADMLLDPKVRSALIVAHPAHEVRIYEWMTISRPWAYLLTTGSRSGDDRTRWEASREVICDAGAGLVAGWGGIQDRTLYSQLLSGDVADFVNHASALADDFVRREVELVVTDSWQYYNVVHDLTHVITCCAASIAGARMHRPIHVVDYPVVPHSMAPLSPRGDEVLTLALTPDRHDVKLEAVRRIPLISEEVAEIVAIEGPNALRAETFSLPTALTELRRKPTFKPYYEGYGEQRVQVGRYMDVIRWHHVEKAVNAVAALCEPRY